MGHKELRSLGAVEIAEVVFGLHSNWPKPILWIRDAYPMFLSRRDPAIHLAIRYQARWPKRLPMKVSNEPAVSWNGDDFSIRTAYYEAEGNLSKGKVEAVMAPGFSGSGLLRTLLAIVLLRQGGFLLHAAGLLKGERSYVFCGPTQSGKTTIATHLANGHLVLSDETTAIRPTSFGYSAYSTPFPGDMNRVFVNRGARMDSLFFIRKGNEFSRRPLSPAEVTSRAFPQLICLERNLEGVEAAFHALEAFSHRIPCYDLSFRPTLELWSHLP